MTKLVTPDKKQYPYLSAGNNLWRSQASLNGPDTLTASLPESNRTGRLITSEPYERSQFNKIHPPKHTPK